MSRAEDLFQRITTAGEAAIDEFILGRKSEELFLDFKRSADNGSSHRLHPTDRKNLGRAISGFANSEGGVIVWGIDCRQGPGGADVAQSKFPLSDAAAFVSWLEGAVSGCTIPPCQGVRSVAIPTEGQGGFAATYIPKSARAPHQDLSELRYYIRAGSDFLPTPHGVLAGIFGRRPEPYVFHQFYLEPVKVTDEYAVESIAGVVIVSDGPGIAKDVFLSIDLFHPGGESQFYLEHANEAAFSYCPHFDFHLNIVSRDSFKLPPGGRVHIVTLKFRLAPPFRSSFHFTMNYGCAGAPTKQLACVHEPGPLAELCYMTADQPSEERVQFLKRGLFGDSVSDEISERTPMVTNR